MTHVRSRGFSLIELAVVIALSSTFIGFALQLAQQKTQENREAVTKARMEYVLLTLENFVRRYGRLPCPADPTLAFSASGFGLETPPTPCSTAAGAHLVQPGSGIFIGAVPVYTLQLPPRYMLDGWNNRFTYAMDGDLSTTAGYGSNPISGTVGHISVRNWANSPLCGEPASDGATPPLPTCSAEDTDAALALVSHGANGYGAWPGPGAGRTATTGAEATHEVPNAGSTTIYYQAPPTGVYDDIVMFRRKWQMPTPCTTSCP